MIYQEPTVYNTRTVYDKAGGGNKNSIELGGITYKLVQIGNLLWIDKNLNWCPPGINFNPVNFVDGNANAAYFQKAAQEVFTDAGMLYNIAAVNIIDNLIQSIYPGFRVPSNDDLWNMVNSLGGLNEAGEHLKTVDYGGDNSAKFNGLLSGWIDSNGNSARLNEWGPYWSTTERDTDRNEDIYINSYGAAIGYGAQYKRCGLAIRLCKDA